MTTFNAVLEINPVLSSMIDTTQLNAQLGSIIVGGSDQVLEQGTTYYDIPNNYMYVVFGIDGDWEAIRFQSTDETTGPQTGLKPTTLTTLLTLNYT